MEYYDRLVDYLRWRAWSIIKFVKHVFTGFSELERISQDHNSSKISHSDVDLIAAVDESLRNSSQLVSVLSPVYSSIPLPRSKTFIQSIFHTNSKKPVQILPINRDDIDNETDRIVRSIAETKKLTGKPLVLEPIKQSIKTSLSINALVGELESLAQTLYDESNSDHEDQLMQLWSIMLPNRKLTSRRSSDWDLLGFQGQNPATDFRGAGILGLMNLLSFGENCRADSEFVLNDCRQGGLTWFSYAITGLNLTFDLIRLTKEHALDRYYIKYGTSLDSFNSLYSTVFVRFNQTWRRNQPKSVMEFAHIRAIFLKELRQLALYAHLDTYEHLQPLGKFYERLEPKQTANHDIDASETTRLIR